MELSNTYDMYEYGENELYALFEIITERFVFVSSSRYVMQMIVMLFSSRYQLVLCRIDCAKNYEKNLVHNEGPLTWSMAPIPRSANIIGNFRYYREVYHVPEIIKREPLPESELVVQDAKFMRYVFYTISEMFSFAHNQIDGYMHEIDYTFRDMISAPFVHSRTDLFNKEIFAIIHSEFDVDVAKEKIKNAFEQYTLQ